MAGGLVAGAGVTVLLEIPQQGRAELLMHDTFTFVDNPPF